MNVLITLLLLITQAIAQFPGSGMYQPKKAPAHKEDIRFIQCQVCDKIVQVMRKQVKDLRASSGRLEEAKILDLLEEVCNPETDSGEWITMLDLVEQGDKLTVVDTQQVGECTWECQTVARACDNIMEDADLSDFSSYLYSDSKTRAQLANWLCVDSTGVCRKKVPPLPKDRPAGPPHRPLTEKDLSAQKVLRSMKKAGLSGTLMDREAMKAELDEARASGLMDDMAEQDGMGATNDEGAANHVGAESSVGARSHAGAMSDFAGAMERIKAGIQELKRVKEERGLGWGPVAKIAAEVVWARMKTAVSNLSKKVLSVFGSVSRPVGSEARTEL